jgi:Phosphodiester glycosidase
MITTSTLSGRDAAIPRAVATDGAQPHLATQPDLFLGDPYRYDAALDDAPFVYTERVALSDDSKTTVHVLRQELRNTVVKVANLGSARRVTDVCNELGGHVVAAMSGGFFAREAGQPLGELWIAGERQSHVPFPAPWHDIRGSLHVDTDGITIDRRAMLPARPDGDLLQAGPVLATGGRPVVDLAADGEGFHAGSGQFDSDITNGRHPRAAIGYDDTYVYGVVVDGRTDGDVGMSLIELAEYMTERLGVVAALNLDGGGSATLAARDPEGAFHVINNPMDGYMQPTPGGSRELYSALVFAQV